AMIEGLEPAEYLVNANGQIVYKILRNFSADLRADNAQLEGSEKLRGPQAVGDQNTYRVWHRSDPSGGAPQRFLVNEQGQAIYLVDPGINGTHRLRPDGSAVQKFDAPKATLMSY